MSRIKFGFSTLVMILIIISYTQSVSAAIILDFDVVSPNTSQDFVTYVEDGYEMVITAFGQVRVDGFFTGSPAVHPSFGFDDHSLLLTKSGGGAFDLVSFDLNDAFTSVVPFDILGKRSEPMPRRFLSRSWLMALWGSIPSARLVSRISCRSSLARTTFRGSTT